MKLIFTLLIISSYGYFITVQAMSSPLNSTQTKNTITNKSDFLFDTWWKQALWGLLSVMAGLILFAICVIVTHNCNECFCKCKQSDYSPANQPIIFHT
jgi:uncharacterized membrane protein